MGTDIYLEWDGKAEADREAQATGWSIDAGSVGYLRASVGMVRENALLRALFAEKYWLGRSRDEYDFKREGEMLDTLGLKYLLSVASGKPLTFEGDGGDGHGERDAPAVGISEALKKLADRFGASEGFKVYVGDISEFRDAVKWLNSLFEFFELGVEKQAKGLNPYPYISW